MVPCPAIDADLVAEVRNATAASANGDAYTAALAYDAVLVATVLAVRLQSRGVQHSIAAAAAELRDISFEGVTGLLNLTEAAGGGVGRAPDDTRVSVLTFPPADAAARMGAGADKVADVTTILAPSAIVTFTATAPAILSPIEGGVSIVWPGGTTYPPAIPTAADVARRAEGGGGVPQWVIWLVSVTLVSVLLATVVFVVVLRQYMRRARVRLDAAASDRGFGVPYLKGLYGVESVDPDGLHARNGVAAGQRSPRQGWVNRVAAAFGAVGAVCGCLKGGERGRMGAAALASLSGADTGEGSGSRGALSAREAAKGQACAPPQQQRSLIKQASRFVGLDGALGVEGRRASRSVTGSAALISKGVPQAGEAATLVITDIQASSRLWATCPAAMNADVEKHDRLLRHMMLLYNGIEIATEGDSFQVVFRDARDAVRWCIAVQVQLLRVDWSPEVLAACPADAGVVTVAAAEGQVQTAGAAVPDAVHGIPALGAPVQADRHVVFRGLRVRMGGHTAVVASHRFDPATSTHAYKGALMDTARAACDAASGGQIVLTRPAVTAVQSIAHLASARYGDVALLHEGRHYLTPPLAAEAHSFRGHFLRELVSATLEAQAGARSEGDPAAARSAEGDGGCAGGKQESEASVQGGAGSTPTRALSGESSLPLEGILTHRAIPEDRGDAPAASRQDAAGPAACGERQPPWRQLAMRLPRSVGCAAPLGESTELSTVESGAFELSLRRPGEWSEPGAADVSTPSPLGSPRDALSGRGGATLAVPYQLSSAALPDSVASVTSDGDRPSPLPQFAFPRIPPIVPRHPPRRARVPGLPLTPPTAPVPTHHDVAALVPHEGGSTFESVAAAHPGGHDVTCAAVSGGASPASLSPRGAIAAAPLLSPTMSGPQLSSGSALLRTASHDAAPAGWLRGWQLPRVRSDVAALGALEDGAAALEQVGSSQEHASCGRMPAARSLPQLTLTALLSAFKRSSDVAAGGTARCASPEPSVRGEARGYACGHTSFLVRPAQRGLTCEGRRASLSVVQPVASGRRLLRTTSTRSLVGKQVGESPASSSARPASDRPVVLDLYSVTPVYLFPRHAHFAPLATAGKITPSYLDAPRAGPLTICYTYLAHVKDLDAWDAAESAAAVRAVAAVTRDCLLEHGGYEVRELSGNFLLAFAVPAEALAFAVALQHELMHFAWSEALLAQPWARAISIAGALAFRGPRVRIALSSGSLADGSVTDILPEPRTGRAKYLGALPNHAARVASVTHGGQTVAADSTVTAAGGRAALAARGLRLVELGSWRLKGFSHPCALWQVEDAALSLRAFPAPRRGKATPAAKPTVSGLIARLGQRLGRGGSGAAAGPADAGLAAVGGLNAPPRSEAECSDDSSAWMAALVARAHSRSDLSTARPSAGTEGSASPLLAAFKPSAAGAPGSVPDSRGPAIVAQEVLLDDEVVTDIGAALRLQPGSGATAGVRSLDLTSCAPESSRGPAPGQLAPTPPHGAARSPAPGDVPRLPRLPASAAVCNAGGASGELAENTVGLGSLGSVAELLAVSPAPRDGGAAAALLSAPSAAVDGSAMATALLQLSADAMEIVDEEGALVAVNDAWVAMTGYSAADVLGHNIGELVAPAAAAAGAGAGAGAGAARAGSTGGSGALEHMRCRSGGMMWQHVRRIRVAREGAARASCLTVVCRRDVTGELLSVCQPSE